ncbi:flagellar hook-associated protein FlgL [Xenorhabdus thailandensis]|uniref:flagellar hook-associated protein FlgL n=1 Tax=Xenorhabdus thailandensis TaxID=3136255 RepID=UPI0030F40419
MRVSTNLLYSQKMNGVFGSQSKWMQYGDQLSSGKRVINPSDDPLAASQGIMIAQSESQNQQFVAARVFARNTMSIQSSTISSVVSVTINVKERLIAAASEQSDHNRESYAQQLDGLKQQLMNLGNQTDGNGRYIFAGYKTDEPPFEADNSGKVHYKGGDRAISQRVDDNRSMVIAHTGEKVFLSATSNPIKEPDGSVSESDIFASIDFALEALGKPFTNASEAERKEAKELIDRAIRGVENSLNNLYAADAVLGVQLQEMEQLDALASERSIANQVRMGELLDVDWVSTISSYYQEQAALNASYKAFSDLKGMSLFEMYR